MGDSIEDGQSERYNALGEAKEAFFGARVELDRQTRYGRGRQAKNIAQLLLEKMSMSRYRVDPSMYTMLFVSGSSIKTSDEILLGQATLSDYAATTAGVELDCLVLNPNYDSAWARGVEAHTIRSRRVTEEWGADEGFELGQFRTDLVRATECHNSNSFAIAARESTEEVVRVVGAEVELPGFEGALTTRQLDLAATLVSSVIQTAKLVHQLH